MLPKKSAIKGITFLEYCHTLRNSRTLTQLETNFINLLKLMTSSESKSTEKLSLNQNPGMKKVMAKKIEKKTKFLKDGNKVDEFDGVRSAFSK